MHTTAHEGHDTQSKTFFGFWLFLMTDCILFATLFATYAVLVHGTAGGPTGKDLFNLPFILLETLLLLVSSFTCGIAQVAANKEQKAKVLTLLVITFLLGAVFFGMAMTDFTQLVKSGYDWSKSAFLSSYFVLVGTLACHVLFGLLWMAVMVGQILKKGLTGSTHRRFTCLRLFWHFLNVVWVFIFSIVYLVGAI